MLHHTHVKSSKNILLVEDNVGDVRLIQEAVEESGKQITLNVVTDGAQAMDYLCKRSPYDKAITPDLILLDLNLPKKNGKQVLLEIKNDPALKRIPVLVLTISQSEDDILDCYNLHANGYIIKPFQINEVIQLFQSIQHFWFNIVKLPPKKEIRNG